MKVRLIAGTINHYPAGEGWENVHLDKSERPLYDLERRRKGRPPELIGDLVDLDRLAGPASFHEVRSWQVLEHLTPERAPIALANIHRVLVPGGVFDVEVPNVEALIAGYVAGDLPLDDLLRNLYGSSAKMEDDHLNAHRWGWTPATLADALERAGFDTLERMEDESGYQLRFRATK